MTRDEALADLAASMTDGELGSRHTIDGVEVQAVRRDLSIEEAQAFAGDGLLTESFRLTVEASKLSYHPPVGARIDVDGIEYDVKAVWRIGILSRFICMRYLG